MKYLLKITIICLSLTSFAANDIKLINAYKYVILPPLDGNANYTLSKNYSLVKKKFRTKGFKIEPWEYRFWESELQKQPGIGMYPQLSFVCEENNKRYEMNLELVDIKRERIYQNSASVTWEEDFFDGEATIQTARDRAMRSTVDSVFKEIDQFPYKFNPAKMRNMDFAVVRKTEFTYKSLKSYFKKNRHDLHEIEGFYVNSEFSPLFGRSFIAYKVAIVRDDYESKYNMIVISSIDKTWKEGEIKASFEYVDESDNLFNTDYFLHDKYRKELVSEYVAKDSQIIVGNRMKVFRKIYSY